MRRQHNQAMNEQSRRARGYNPNRPTTSRQRDEEEEEDLLSVYFDIESMQERGEEGLRHVPNLVVACTETSPLRSWYGPDCIRDFIYWLDNLLEGEDADTLPVNNDATLSVEEGKISDEENSDTLSDNEDNTLPANDNSEEDSDNESTASPSKRKITVIAHNFQGYDSYFVIQEYHRQARDLSQIRNGGKVLELKVGKKDHERIRFIDSMSFLPFGLAKFKETFGFEDDDDNRLALKKGFFPHFFNTPDNQDYVGSLPAREHYGPHTMSNDRYEEFDRWYTATAALQEDFDFRRELLAYCESDVRLL